MSSSSIIIYVALAVIVLFGLTYVVVIRFSHQPRLPLPAELKYRTNDADNQLYPLPPRIHPDSSFKYRDIDLSLVIPCLNEAKRLGPMLDETVEYLETHYKDRYEILVIDDESVDDTAGFAIEKAKELNMTPHVMRVIELAPNRGKGAGVAHGLLYSRGKWGLFADADGATKFSDVEKLLECQKDTKDDEPAVSIGSRYHMDGDNVVKRSFIRKFLMKGYKTLVFIFGVKGINDTQCGFKMFNFEATKKIFPHLHNDRWVFDFEVLILAEMQGIKVKEIPVNWQEMDGSKVDLARDSIGMARDLVITRLAYMLGIYKLDECGRAGKKIK